MYRLTIALIVVLMARPAPAVVAQDNGRLIDRVAAVVDGAVITFSDIVSHVADQGRQLPEANPERDRLAGQILEELIDRELIVRAATENPFFEVTDEDVENYVRQRREVQGEALFQSRLEASGLSLREYRRVARDRVSVNRFIELRFQPFVIVLPDEIEEHYVELYGELGDLAPPRADADAGIRSTLEDEKVQQQLERWVRAERRKADVQILLFRDPSQGNRPPG